MRTTMSLLCLTCLALIAGATFANITPDVPEGKAVVPSPVDQPDDSIPGLTKTQMTATCGPSLGSCSSLTFGFCDCDVPLSDFSCQASVDLHKQVYTCYSGGIICGVGPKCNP